MSHIATCAGVVRQLLEGHKMELFIGQGEGGFRYFVLFPVPTSC